MQANTQVLCFSNGDRKESPETVYIQQALCMRPGE